ncbi:MAG: response regulator transcription factor [Candidatus Obscuribacterales bacterium]|nr:response regulator transcription factor [Candidatus Obscuribacterales bacterium]
MRVLIIEDDQRIAEPIRDELEHQKYLVDVAYDGCTGLDMAKSGKFDMILLDLMLPEPDGINICQAIRDANITSPILILSALTSKKDKIMGLDSGADDYVTKPFDLDELSARVRALSRRCTAHKKAVISSGQLSVNTSTCQVMYDETPVDLTPTEYRMLTYLLRNPNTPFTRESLIENLWLNQSLPGEEAIKTHIKTLRKKLVAAGAPKNLIETVYGFGYKLNVSC